MQVLVDPPPVLIVMGVSGSGKTTLARELARRLGWQMLEGDEEHPASNVAKMAAGIPLTDADRWPWLDKIAEWIAQEQASGHPAVVTCSALKRAYRDRLARPHVVFVHPHGNRSLLESRLEHRKGHFMPVSLLDSQLETLEPIQPDEHGFVVSAELPLGQAVDDVIGRLAAAGMIRVP